MDDSAPLVSVNILTKNRAELLRVALLSVQNQSFNKYEIVVVDDGSGDGTQDLLQNYQSQMPNLKTIRHSQSAGITQSRQEALQASLGEYIAILDDDDEWADTDKLKKQVEFFQKNPQTVLVGGGRYVFNPAQPDNPESPKITRPETDAQIRKTMLLRNNFFTSTVMFKKSAALKAGGFISWGADLAEDYHLWLRLGKLGQMHNFPEAFDKYRLPSYNKAKLRLFLDKQFALIKQYKQDYPGYFIASIILRLRLLFGV